MPSRTKLTENKEKVGTVLDRNILRSTKERAAREGRTISDIIQDALLKYNETDTTNSELRKSAIKRFCSKPFNLSTREIKELLNKDVYEL